MENSPYHHLEFPSPPLDRPTCYINMVATIDGKILSGDREDHVLDLGSKVDHLLMKRIESSADAIMIGAQTLRASPPTWNPTAPKRIVVSRSGKLPLDSNYLKSGQAYIATSEFSKFPNPPGIEVLRIGAEELDLYLLFRHLRQHLDINRLVVMGGSELNAQLLAANLVDELFLTIAPKIKLGRDVPTYADGDPLLRENLQRYHLVEHHAIGDEIFIRYRREGTTFGASPEP